MFDIYTFFIYTTLLFSIYQLNKEKSLKRINVDSLFCDKFTLNVKEIISLLFIAVIVGFRYEVGNDWYNYKEFYLESGYISIDDYYFEPGYFYFNQILNKIGFSYQLTFFFLAAFTWYIVFKSLHKKYLAYLLFFIFCTEFFFWSMNGVRQFIAIVIFGFSIRFIIEKKIYKYILSLFFASLFHSSAILLLPAYFLRNKFFYNRYIFIILFIISFLFGTNPFTAQLIEQLLSNIILLLQLERGAEYLIQSGGLTRITEESISIGIGYYLFILTNFVVILLSRNIIDHNKKLSIYFTLFFMGSIIYNLTFWSPELIRVNQYFIYFKSFCLTFIVHYYFNFSNKKFIGSALILLFLINFLAMIYVSSNMSNPYRMLGF